MGSFHGTFSIPRIFPFLRFIPRICYFPSFPKHLTAKNDRRLTWDKFRKISQLTEKVKAAPTKSGQPVEVYPTVLLGI